MSICGEIVPGGTQPSPIRCCQPPCLFCRTSSFLHSCHLRIPTNLTEVATTLRSAIIPPLGSWDPPGYQHCGFILGTGTRRIKQVLPGAPLATVRQGGEVLRLLAWGATLCLTACRVCKVHHSCLFHSHLCEAPDATGCMVTQNKRQKLAIRTP